MLGPGQYLLGIAQILALVGFATLGATAARRRWASELTGSTAALGTIVLAAALLIWVAELLGSFGAFSALPYLLATGIAAVGLWGFSGGWRGRGGAENGRRAPARRPPHDRVRPRPPIPFVPVLISLTIALIAVLNFADGVHAKLGTGMTGFDSTWYHGPFAAGFHASGDTWGLHHIAPQFMAWFYPANSELFHAIGMNAFDRDLLSPLLNLGWFLCCLLACWAIGRPYRMGPATLALGALALSVPALADQAGEARNDIVGIFFLLAAVAILLDRRPAGFGGIALIGLAAGLAAGTKLNFLLPSAAGLGALAGGGYWYLRNLVHSGNPLPWFDQLGPIALPGPSQELGGREQHSVLSYLTDGSVWSDWFLPGLRDGLGIVWPLLLVLALAGLALCLSRRAEPALRVAALVGLAAGLSWLVAPTSASGPEGIPRGFESGLRYLAPALVLGMALLPTTPAIRSRLAGFSGSTRFPRVTLPPATERVTNLVAVSLSVGLLAAIGVGYLVQRDYLRDRYANPTFTTPGLNAAFRWATPLTDARIATTSTRQYPLFGTELSNEIDFVGETRPQGGFVAPDSCRAWRRLIDEGGYDYVVASFDRVEPGEPDYSLSAAWTEGPGVEVVLAVPPTKVLRLSGPLDPKGCPADNPADVVHPRP